MAWRWPPASTSRHGSTARVIGHDDAELACPRPARCGSRRGHAPPRRWPARRRARRPGPEISETNVAVDTPLRKTRYGASSSESVAVSPPPSRAASARTRSTSMPPPVVGDGDDHLGPELHGVEAHGRLRRLARGHPLVGRLDAVVDGVADQVQQRVAELLEHAAVELGVLAPHLPAHVLARRPGPRRGRPGAACR